MELIFLLQYAEAEYAESAMYMVPVQLDTVHLRMVAGPSLWRSPYYSPNRLLRFLAH
jgi:hypothetical protein